MDRKDPKPLAVKRRHAAKLLNVCTRSIFRYVDKGLLESVDVHGLKLIKYSSIEKLLGLNEEAA
jgi:hypothetical protein